MAKSWSSRCVVFSCLSLVKSINIGQEETTVPANPSLQKLLRSERDPERTQVEDKVEQPKGRWRGRAAGILEVEIASDGELNLAGELGRLQSSSLNGCGWGDWSSWSQCSASCGEGTVKRSRAVQSKEGGDTLFAVKNAELYKQSVSLLSPTSSWLKVQDDMALESIAISGNLIYGISAEHKLYRQHLSNLTTSSWMPIANEGSWSQILPYRDSLYGISDTKILKATGGNMSEEWSPAAWGEQWKQLAIGDGGEATAYGLGNDGKLYQQNLMGMSTESSWQLVSDRAFLQVAASGGKIYGVGTDNCIYAAEGSASIGQWSKAAPGSSWTSVLLSGGMLYALSKDQELSRRPLAAESAAEWTSAAEQGFSSFAVQRAAYTLYSVAIPASSAGWCIEEMRFFDPTGGLLTPQRGMGARSFRRPTFCGNSRSSVQYEFAQPAVVDRYYLQGGKSATGATEVDWTLQGSLDGSHWITLDERTDMPASGEMQSFDVLSQICDISDAGEQQNCSSVKPCPEDCTFSDWSDWTCAKCATNSVRNRTILSEAKHGGSCDDDKQTGHRCDPSTCPVDCVYNDWSPWTLCPVTCGSGRKTRNRTVKEEMRYGGQPCDKATFEKEVCNGQQCPVDCTWNDWGDYTACSDSCGGGKKRRKRTSNPAKWGGLPCKGDDNETVACAVELCPVDCQWGDWQSWSDCSKMCGGGRKERQRSIAVQGGYGGLMCNQSAKEAIDCNVAECSADCLWSDWTLWSRCSASCGGGRQNRSRQLKKEAQGKGGCAGKPKEHGDCNADPCPNDCVMSDWSQWSPCSKTCGPGLRSRQKSPVKEPAHGGAQCVPANQTEDCITVELAKCIPSEENGQRDATSKVNTTSKASSQADVKINATNASRSSSVNASGNTSAIREEQSTSKAQAEDQPGEAPVEASPESMKTLDSKRPFSRPGGEADVQWIITNFDSNASDANKSEFNLTDLLAKVLGENRVSHCMVYQRQPDVPMMRQREVFALKGTRTIDDCCYRCSYYNPSGESEKECTAFQVMESPSGARYCVLATGEAYNASMADSDGPWMVKMPKSEWPSAYATSTSTTTVTTVTTTSSTSTVTSTTVTETSTTVTETTTTVTTVTTVTNTTRAEPTRAATTTSNSSIPPTSIRTTGTTTTVAMTTVSTEEERDFMMGIPEEDTKMPEVPKTRAQWLVAAKTESCDATCASVGEQCDFLHLKATADSQRETQVAFAQAGFSCLSFGTGCSPEDCPGWGAPFLHQSFMEGSTLKRNGQGDPCFLGNDVAKCDQVPKDLNHRRLCACSVKNANTTVVGYEVLEVSNVESFLGSSAIKDSIVEAVALLADVPKTAVQVFLQYLKTANEPDAAAKAGSVVMVHVINASATCKTPEAIRMSLEADARADTVNKVLKPLLEAEGPFEEVGPGSCRDADGNEYDAFSHNKLDTLKGCKDACMLFDAAHCHGFTFETGRCQLRMEDGFTEVSGDWTLSWAAGTGRGNVASSTGTGATRCFRRTDVPDLKATENVTETSSEGMLSSIVDSLPSIGDMFSGIGKLFR